MRFFLLLSVISLCIGCKTNKPVSELTSEDVKIEMFKGSCYGKCPIYTIKVYKGGYTTLLATQFGDKQGEYHRTLSKKEYKNLVKAFEEAKFSSFKETYPSDIVDLPLVTITFKDDDARYLTQGRDNRPDALMKLQYMLEDLYDREGWINDKPVEVMTEFKKPEPVDMTAGYLKSRIIVKLKENVTIESWIKDMDAFDLTHKRTLSKDLNLHLITYNTSQTKPARMLRLIKGHPDVLQAEFDKPIQQRSK